MSLKRDLAEALYKKFWPAEKEQEEPPELSDSFDEKKNIEIQPQPKIITADEPQHYAISTTSLGRKVAKGAGIGGLVMCLVFLLEVAAYGKLMLIEPNVYILSAEIIAISALIALNVRYVMEDKRRAMIPKGKFRIVPYGRRRI